MTTLLRWTFYSMPAILAKSAEFDESKHPRADDGKFGSGGGSEKKPASQPSERARHAVESVSDPHDADENAGDEVTLGDEELSAVAGMPRAWRKDTSQQAIESRLDGEAESQLFGYAGRDADDEPVWSGGDSDAIKANTAADIEAANEALTYARRQVAELLSHAEDLLDEGDQDRLLRLCDRAIKEGERLAALLPDIGDALAKWNEQLLDNPGGGASRYLTVQLEHREDSLAGLKAERLLRRAVDFAERKLGGKSYTPSTKPPPFAAHAALYARALGDGKREVAFVLSKGFAARFPELELCVKGETFDESKHPRADDGKFGSGASPKARSAVDKVKQRAAGALTKLASAKEAAARFGKAAFDKLPPDAQEYASWLWDKAKYVEHKVMTGFHKTRELAVEAAKARGMDDAGAERLGKVLGTADLALAWTVNMPATMALTGNLAAAKASSWVPVASLGYVAYSTARNPMSVLRAARAVLARRHEKKAFLSAAESAGFAETKAVDVSAAAIGSPASEPSTPDLYTEFRSYLNNISKAASP